MKPARSLTIAACLALAGLGAGLVGGDVAARPKPPPVELPPPPPMPPPMPDIGLAERFIHDAAAYEAYMRQAAAISPDFADAGGVAQSLKLGVAYEPGQFQRGEVAYAAIAALQDRAFVEAVRKAGATPEGRYTVVGQIFANPANALVFTDGPTAAGLAKAALSADGMRVFTNGVAVRKEAYDVQHQPWSHDDVDSRDARLAGAKLLSTSPRMVADEDAASLRGAIARAAGPAGMACAQPMVAMVGQCATDPLIAPPPYSPLVLRATALAALAAIGQAGDDMYDRLSWLSQDYFTQHCLAHAKNELNECLAVAKPNYEDIFCLGEPAMMYTGACVVKGAYSTVPLEILTRPIAVAPVHRGARRRR
jgi:hypothetical protein